jgi:hypothetical protein
MADGMEIESSFDTSSIVAGLDKIIERTESLSEATRKLNDENTKAVRTTERLRDERGRFLPMGLGPVVPAALARTPSPYSYVPGAPSLPSLPPYVPQMEQMRRISGPYQRLEQLERLQAQYFAGGASNSEFQDLRLRMEQAQRAVDRANNFLSPAEVLEKTQKLPREIEDRTSRYTWNDRQNARAAMPERTQRYRWNERQAIRDSIPEDTYVQKAARAFLSSRFQIGGQNGSGGIMPLVGQSLDAAGISSSVITKAIANPYIAAGALVLGAVTEVAKRAVQVTNEAAHRTEYGANQRFIGGGQFGQLSAFGINASTSRGVFDRIASDPYAAMFASGLGVHNTPGPFGQLDTAKGTQQILDELRKLNRTQQQRILRGIPELETPEVLRYLRASQQSIDKLKQTGMITDRLQTPYTEQQASDYELSADRRNQSISNFWQSVGQTLAPIGTFFNNVVAENADFDTKTSMWIRERFNPEYGKKDDTESQQKTKTVPEQQLEEQKRTNEALARIHGAIGGGERSRNAFPAYLSGPNGRGEMVNRAVERSWVGLGVV